MIERNSLSTEEWGNVIAVPASIGALVVTADPSGPMGLIKEFRAVMNTFKSYTEQNAAAGPLIGAIHEHLMTKPTEEEEAEMKKWADAQQEEMKANRPQTAEEMKALVREMTTEVLAMLRAKGATEEDVTQYKGLMFATPNAWPTPARKAAFWASAAHVSPRPRSRCWPRSGKSWACRGESQIHPVSNPPI